MRKLFYLVVSIVILGLIISGCIFPVVPPSEQDESIDIVKDALSYKTNLIAGQHVVAGLITVSNDDETLFITYETVDNWIINETHLYVGTTIPTKSAPGKFPYKHEELGEVTTDTYEIPLEDLEIGPCDKIYIAAHAELIDGTVAETGWAEGVEITLGKNWAMYFEYQLSCDVVQEVLFIHDLAEQKLNDIVEGPGIDIENTLTILGEYLNEQTGVESTVIDYNLLQINYLSGLISFILLQDITAEPTSGSNIARENTLSIPLNQQTRGVNVIGAKSTIYNYGLRVTKDIDDVVVYTGNRDILIWAPSAAEFKSYGYDKVTEYTNRFKNSTLTFNIFTLDNEKADLDSLKNITNYGMVIFVNHGENGNWLGTGEVVPWYLDNPIYETWLKLKHLAIWQNMKVKGEGGILAEKSVYAVNSSWFKSNLSGNFPNTIIFNDSCESLKTDAFWDVFKEKGAGAYFGFDNIVTVHFATEQGCDLIEKLREGELTTGEAYQPKFDPYGKHSCLWVLKGNFNLKFPRDLVFIWVLPETMTLVEEDSQPITSITAYYDGGSLADISLDACTYESSDTGVATVDTGVITAVAPGTATITVKYTEGDITKTDTVEVTVTPEVVGQISGSVKDAVIQSPLQGVSVKVYDGNLLILISSGTTDSSGVYSISVPAGSGYRAEFTKSGYIPAIYYDVSVVADVTTYLETVLQIDDSYSGLGAISGTISNALTGGGVSGLTIKFREGINVTSGTVITSTATGSGGYYSVNLNAGYYTAEASGTGYNTGYFTVICIGGTTTADQDATITPILLPGETRIILTWGETPRDLDSHLTGPLPDETRFHMYYPYTPTWGGSSPWPEYVKLDLDDITSYGPETTTIYQQIPGVYRFSVHDFTNRGSSYSTALSNSGAQVRVYRGNNIIVTFNVPANQEGTLWTVFEMDGDTIIPINTMSYESYPGDIRQSSAPDAELMKNLPPKR